MAVREKKNFVLSAVWISQKSISETAVFNAFAFGKHLVAIFFDIGRAYNTACRHGILQKPHSLGFCGTLAVFLRKLLTDRRFHV